VLPHFKNLYSQILQKISQNGQKPRAINSQVQKTTKNIQTHYKMRFGNSLKQWTVKITLQAHLRTMQSLQNYFAKAVAADTVSITALYIKIATCSHSLGNLQNYLQMQNNTTNYSCQNVFEN